MATLPITPTMDTMSEDYRPLIKTETDGNYPRVRPIATRSRKKFDLKFTNITKDNYDTLKTFFDANQGIPFDFTYPTDNITYSVISVQDSLPLRQKSTNIVSTQWRVEEL